MDRGLPSLWVSLVPLVILVALISIVVSIFGDETLSGASQISLIVATSVCLSIGLLSKDVTWADFEKALSDKMGSISGAVIILLLIGALGGSWMVGGIVPTLIYYGMQIMSPQWFLVSACLICALVSVITGSSWTTIATIGIALMGIGQAIGYDEAWTAGAIISGAYFGDKISPLSDTTVLASSTAGTPLFTHIRYMLYTTVPAFLITLTVFAIKGLGFAPTQADHALKVANALQDTFFISPWLLTVPVLTGVLIAMRLPSMVVLFLATLMGTVTAAVTPGALLDEIAKDNLYVAPTFAALQDAVKDGDLWQRVKPRLSFALAAGWLEDENNGGIWSDSALLTALPEERFREIKDFLGPDVPVVFYAFYKNRNEEYLDVKRWETE